MSLNNPGCNFLSLHAESTSGEIGAIIKAIVDTDKLLRQIIEATPGTVIIPLPHKLYYADVSEYLKGVPYATMNLLKA